MSSPQSSMCSDIWSQLKLVRYELFTIFIILVPVAIPLTIDAQLQEDTYGKDRFYLISGCLSTLQGIINVAAGPLVGSMSDFFGRTKPVVFCVILVSMAPLAVVITENYWVYYIVRSICGWYGPAFSVVVASVIDKFRRNEAEQLAEVAGVGSNNSVSTNNNNNNANSNNSVSYTEENNNSNNNNNSDENNENQGRTKTTASRIGSLSIAVLMFVAGLLVGSMIGTAIQDKRDKFIVQLCLCVVAILWIFFVGVSEKTATVTQEVLAAENREQAQDQRNGEEGENGISYASENDSLISTGNNNNNSGINGSNLESVSASDTAAGATSMVDSTTDQLAHAHTPKEKILKMLRNRNLMIICAIVFMDFLAEQTLQSLLLLYVKDQLNMDSKDQEVILLVFGLSSIIALLFTIRLLTRQFNLMTGLRLALTANSISVILVGFAAKKWECVAICLLATVGVCVFSQMNSVSSLVVADEDAGVAQGFVAAARFGAEGLSPAIFGVFMQEMKGKSYPLPGMPFIVAGLCPLIGVMLSYFLPADIGEKSRVKRVATAQQTRRSQR